MHEDDFLFREDLPYPLRFPRTLALVAFRDDRGVVETNVPRVITEHAPARIKDRYDMGYEIGPGEAGALSPGVLDLALNTLNSFVPPEKDGEELVMCGVNAASRTAWELHEEFAREVLANVDPDGYIEMPVRELYGWIEAKKKLPAGFFLSRR